MNNKYKINIPLFLAGVLLCLTLISFNLTGNLYAKYSTSSTGSDSARVARFGVSTITSSNPAEITLTAGDSASTGTYTFTITNNSEVVVKNSIIVNDVPDNVQVKVEFSGPEQTKTGAGNLTFDIGELGIGKSVDCTLTFSALEGSTAQTTPVTIQVVTEQVD